jgi:hypothetical protein
MKIKLGKLPNTTHVRFTISLPAGYLHNRLSRARPNCLRPAHPGFLRSAMSVALALSGRRGLRLCPSRASCASPPEEPGCEASGLDACRRRKLVILSARCLTKMVNVRRLFTSGRHSSLVV